MIEKLYPKTEFTGCSCSDVWKQENVYDKHKNFLLGLFHIISFNRLFEHNQTKVFNFEAK